MKSLSTILSIGCGKKKRVILCFTYLFIIQTIASAASLPKNIETPEDLKRLSLEELMEIPVTSPGRRAQPLSSAPTAIDVISNEKIRRSGARSLPDILRLATGLHVAQSGGRVYAISARGFNTSTANKMHVLMDGRSLYTPLYGGVFWDVQNYPIEDIDRIEIIRGPGATMWGANAVNGVINIITKSAKETQGGLLEVGGGNYEQGFGTFRYGGRIGENTYYRAYVDGYNRDGMRLSSGGDAGGDRQFGQAGFRVDSNLDEDDLLTVQGDIYYGDQGGMGNEMDSYVYGGNLLGRWTHTFSDESDFALQIYYDRVGRTIPYLFEEDRDTFDLDFQHRFPLGDWNDIVWGLNYRVSADEIGNASAIGFIPTERTLHLFSGFIQDEITLIEDELALILGTKLEHNDHTGFEFQPSARVSWIPSEWQTVWGSVSRAVRTPTRIDEDVVLPVSATPLFLGSRDFDSEELLAFEIGYRVRPLEPLYIDIATFYNVYDRLRSVEPLPGEPTSIIHNKLDADTYGVELEVNYQVMPWWRFSGSYTYMQFDFQKDADSLDPTTPAGSREGNDPHHLFTIHNSVDLARNVDFDLIFRYVDDLPSPYIPSYLVMDVRLAWFPQDNLELALVGRNLLDDKHPEFTTLREVQQSVYASLTWRF